MQKTEIIAQRDGFLTSVNEKPIFFPNAELMNVGCKNCIWKLHSQCPHGLKDEGALSEGICPEMIEFLLSFADKSNSLTIIWEKFHIYKARLQEAHDYKDYVLIDKKIKLLEKELESGKSKYSDEELSKLMEDLKSDRMSAKIWWSKLNQYVVFSMQKINDRESKQSETPRLPGIQSSGTINFNIGKKEVKQLE